MNATISTNIQYADTILVEAPKSFTSGEDAFTTREVVIYCHGEQVCRFVVFSPDAKPVTVTVLKDGEDAP